MVLLVTLAPMLRAQETPHLTVAQPGGFPGRPLVTGITKTTNGVNVTWDGPAGYYQLYLATELGTPLWQPVGAPNLVRNLTISNLPPTAFFKVLGPSAQYAGSQACLECHEGVHGSVDLTGHTEAFDTLKAIGRHTNSRCLPCHSTGYGLPTGFVSETATPHLRGVQCESCHGPSAAHAANEMDLTKRPRIELAAQVCGGCHNRHVPTYDEWASSGHFKVVEDMNPAGRISACGRCHSGSARLALAKGENPAVTVANDANVGITCAVCHEPHQKRTWTNVLTGLSYTNQLRYAITSTNDFSLATADNFTTKHNVNINVCGQCHNHRGASWTSSGRPPHHSPQYNMMLGTVGELPTGTKAILGTHASLEKQCVTCHMPGATGGSHGVGNHSFRVESYDACSSCHVFPELLKDFTAMVIELRIDQVKADLNLWATTKAPAALSTKYGTRAWEFTVAGDISGGGAGPSSSEQAQIPDNIKRARFNLYIVKYDGSYGSHNPLHSIALLEAARNWVQGELNK